MVCASCAPGPQEAREAKETMEVLAPRYHTQVRELDLYTAPDCWKLIQSDVLNKYPKYFLAPLDLKNQKKRQKKKQKQKQKNKPINFGISFTIYQNTAILESSKEEDNTYTDSILLLQA